MAYDVCKDAGEKRKQEQRQIDDKERGTKGKERVVKKEIGSIIINIESSKKREDETETYRDV